MTELTENMSIHLQELYLPSSKKKTTTRSQSKSQLQQNKKKINFKNLRDEHGTSELNPKKHLIILIRATLGSKHQVGQRKACHEASQRRNSQ